MRRIVAGALLLTLSLFLHPRLGGAAPSPERPAPGGFSPAQTERRPSSASSVRPSASKKIFPTTSIDFLSRFSPLSRLGGGGTPEAATPNGQTVKVKKTYYSNGNLKTWDKQVYRNGKLTQRNYREYYSAGATKSSDDYKYDNGKKTERRHQEFTSKGARTRYLFQSFYGSGRIKESDDYSYSAGKLTREAYRKYNSSGGLIDSKTLNYPGLLYTNQATYLWKYAVDGRKYEEEVSLTEGTNTLQRTKTGYGKASVLVKQQIVLDTVAPVVEIISPDPLPSETFLTTLVVDYTVDGAPRQRSFSLAVGDNDLSIVESDPVGNETTVPFSIKRLSVPTAPSLVSVRSQDRRLFVQNRKPDGTLDSETAFVARGVNWSPASVGILGANIHQEFANWFETDIPLMAEMGVNVVRVFHDFGTGPAAAKILDLFYAYGIKVIVTVDSPTGSSNADLDNVTTVVNAYKEHPAILMWAVGNEWDLNRYYGVYSTMREAADFTEEAAQTIKAIDPNHPVSTFIADPHIPGIHPLSAEAFPFLSGPFTDEMVNEWVPSVDVWGLNLYRGSSFQDALQQWRSISDKPVVIGEFGADSYDHETGGENKPMQAEWGRRLWDEAYFDLSAERTQGTVVGALAFEWNDEWWKNGSPSSHNITSEQNGGQPDGYNDEEWFGLVDIQRNPKSLFTDLKSRFVNEEVSLNATPVIGAISQKGGTSTTAEFTIDGKTVFSRRGEQYGARGINVAVLDPYTGIRMQEVRSFDTWRPYGGPHPNFQKLIDYLNSLPNGSVIALAISDEGGFVNSSNQPWNEAVVESAYQTLEALGSTKIRQVGYRDGWAMITVKGQGVLAEASSPDSAVNIQATASLTLDRNYGKR